MIRRCEAASRHCLRTRQSSIQPGSCCMSLPQCQASTVHRHRHAPAGRRSRVRTMRRPRCPAPRTGPQPAAAAPQGSPWRGWPRPGPRPRARPRAAPRAPPQTGTRSVPRAAAHSLRSTPGPCLSRSALSLTSPLLCAELKTDAGCHDFITAENQIRYEHKQ
jgi:hypothetical protein